MLLKITTIFWDVMLHLLTFLRILLPLFSGYFIICPEDGSRRILCNIDRCLPDYRASHPSYFSNLKMEATGLFERLVNIYQTTWHHIPEDSNLHSHQLENSNLTHMLLLAGKRLIDDVNETLLLNVYLKDVY
jgi:hypothetical protein